MAGVFKDPHPMKQLCHLLYMIGSIEIYDFCILWTSAL